MTAHEWRKESALGLTGLQKCRLCGALSHQSGEGARWLFLPGGPEDLLFQSLTIGTDGESPEYAVRKCPESCEETAVLLTHLE